MPKGHPTRSFTLHCRIGSRWTLTNEQRQRSAEYSDKSDTDTALLEVTAEPVSLAIAITPFNHPLNQVVHKVAPAIAAGTCLVLKPSEKTPLSALYLARVLCDKGLPPHCLNVVTGGAEVVKTLVTYAGVDVVSFTGSVAVGKKIAALMANNDNELVHYVPELGGNAAFAVMNDADLDLASSIALGAFDNCGQRCTAIKRIFLHCNIAAEFKQRFLDKVTQLRHGDPSRANTDLGTLIDCTAAKEIQRRVDAAVESGAQLLCGHHRDGALYTPTVLDKVTPTMELVRSETFGPVAPLLEVSGIDECIDIVRAGRFRLAGAIATASESTARYYAQAICVCQFSWNGPPGYRTEVAPFGGFGDSGNGAKEGIACAIEGLLQQRTFYPHRNN